jgi:D-amino-acid oxidase
LRRPWPDVELKPVDVVVLGAGISGLTTAVLLQSLGFTVTIVAKNVPRQSGDEQPRIPTGYAMASAYPHHLRVTNLERVSGESQIVFQHLAQQSASGIFTYRMFEVFEQEPLEAPLGDKRMKFALFEGEAETLTKTINPPVRPGAQYVWGWTFETYFADMPDYLSSLWTRFLSGGGAVKESHVHSALLDEICRVPVVNCLGLGAIEVFSDASAASIVRGRQVYAPRAPLITGPDKIPVAYNYTPTADIFSRADGQPEYVHLFPRHDGWVLGQTREPGSLDESGEWIGDAVRAPEISIGTTQIPLPIVELNRALLQSWMGLDLPADLVAREGYRYYRDPTGSGVRLELDKTTERLIVHNYGHGGSGVTMSWGCALASSRLLLEALGETPRDTQRRIASNARDPLSELLTRLILSTEPNPVQSR